MGLDALLRRIEKFLKQVLETLVGLLCLHSKTAFLALLLYN